MKQSERCYQGVRLREDPNLMLLMLQRFEGYSLSLVVIQTGPNRNNSGAEEMKRLAGR